jgi:hypothetical protein
MIWRIRKETDLNTRKMNSTKTHRAWFTGCVNFTIWQLDFSKLFASLAYKRNICYMRRYWIIQAIQRTNVQCNKHYESIVWSQKSGRPDTVSFFLSIDLENICYTQHLIVYMISCEKVLWTSLWPITSVIFHRNLNNFQILICFALADLCRRVILSYSHQNWVQKT